MRCRTTKRGLLLMLLCNKRARHGNPYAPLSLSPQLNRLPPSDGRKLGWSDKAPNETTKQKKGGRTKEQKQQQQRGRRLRRRRRPRPPIKSLLLRDGRPDLNLRHSFLFYYDLGRSDELKCSPFHPAWAKQITPIHAQSSHNVKEGGESIERDGADWFPNELLLTGCAAGWVLRNPRLAGSSGYSPPNFCRRKRKQKKSDWALPSLCINKREREKSFSSPRLRVHLRVDGGMKTATTGRREWEAKKREEEEAF